MSAIEGFGANLQQLAANTLNSAKPASSAMARELQAQLDQLQPPATTGIESGQRAAAVAPARRSEAVSFDNTLSRFIDSVDERAKTAGANMTDVMLGRSDNLHQAVLSMRESEVAFSLMVEMRNKLVQSYQELMRISV